MRLSARGRIAMALLELAGSELLPLDDPNGQRRKELGTTSVLLKVLRCD
jgi:hypothetical protein